ncbi:lipopolysaccharide biosynthesis protein [Oceanobacillus polygoni]|uniref:PST family polysaccharide transporter n=1 Tax=Oceanobacillus polygoni TaxID=1235259 RepID=A0A9X0YQG0_9BACI|nr:lipopolysaccharide biosynthesis protein [Oceanobacillus polygoni]MBP2075892.1 PST family polysaccharide transporter [Oceanobacillus polygoni]
MKNSIVSGVLWTFSGTGIQVILQFLVFIILSRLLQPESFGVMSTALALITVLSVFAKIGIGPSLVQKEKINLEHIQTGFTLSIIFSFVITVVVYNSSDTVATFFNMAELSSVLKVLAYVHLIQGFSVVSEALLQRNLEFKKLALVQIISYLVYGIVGVTLSVIGLEVWSLVYAYILNIAVKTLLVLLMNSHSKTISFNFTAAKELLIFGGGYSLSSIYNQVALQGDTFVIGKFLGAVPLGIYSRAYQFYAMPVNLIGTVIEKVLFPSFSRLQSDKEILQESYKNAISLVAIICIPLSLLLFILAEDIIVFLFGDKWLEAVVPFKILILALLPRVSYKISDSLTKSLGKVFKSANRQLVYGVTMIVGVLIGQIYGLVGACIGVSVAIFINYLYMSQIALSLSQLKWKDFSKAHFSGIKLAIVSITPTFILYEVLQIIDFNSFFTISVTGITYLIITSMILYRAPYSIFNDTNKIIIKIFNKIRSRKA